MDDDCSSSFRRSCRQSHHLNREPSLAVEVCNSWSCHPHSCPTSPATQVPIRKVSHDILRLLLAELLLCLRKTSLLTLEAISSLSIVLTPLGCCGKVLEFVRLTLRIDLIGHRATHRYTCTTHNISHLIA